MTDREHDPGFRAHRPPPNRLRSRSSSRVRREAGNGTEIGNIPVYDTGTTVVALRSPEGVVMAADRRMSLGGRFTANKDVRKILPVHPTAAMAIAGSVGPAQNAAGTIRAEASLYEARRGEPMSLEALSRTAGHVLRGRPVAPLLGGVDEADGHVYELDGAGSVVEDAYAAGGSGMQVAYGVLERRFEHGLDLADARAAATDAVRAANERDTASGNGVTIATLTVDGVAISGPSATETASDDGSTGGGVV